MVSKLVLLLAAAAITIVSLAAQASAEVYKVGGSAGWTLKYPSSWTNGKSFTVGDSLMFTYPVGQHTVAEVTGAGFKACDANGNRVLGFWFSGSDTVKLDKAGRRWFVCNVGTHCVQGMKLAITVVDSKASSASLNCNAGAGAATLVAGAAAALLF